MRWTNTKTIKQLAAASLWFIKAPPWKSFPLLNHEGKSKQCASTLSVSSHSVRLLIISLKTAVKRCHRSQSILHYGAKHTVTTAQLCVTWHVSRDMPWWCTSTGLHGAENGWVRHIVVAWVFMLITKSLSVICFLNTHLQSQSSHLQYSWPGNVFHDIHWWDCGM